MTTMIAFSVPTAGTTGSIIKTSKPIALPGEALIRILRAGICNTDLEILKGYMGFTGILGHEFVGIVESVNSDDVGLLGKRVCGDINVGCASCHVCGNVNSLDSRCSKMSRNHCPDRTVLGILKKDGTMSEYITLPISNLHLVPDCVTDEEAVFAEPLAAACRIVEQGLVSAEKDSVAILGDGKLGLMIAEVLGRECRNPEKKPVLFGKHWHKMELVKDSGVECKHVDDACTGYNAAFDVVVDATGSPAGLKLAASLCRPMGTIILKSTCAEGEKFNAAPFVIDELRVVGSRCGPINRALELLSIKEGDPNIKPLNVQKYVTHSFMLKDADKAIACAAEKGTMKVQIICST